MKKVISGLIAAVGILLITAGVFFRQKQSASIAIIGGADGPTSIFVAGKLGGTVFSGMIAAGVLILLGIIIYIKKKREHRDENH